MKLIDKLAAKYERRTKGAPVSTDSAHSLKYNFESIRKELSKSRPLKKEIEYYCYYINFHASKVSKSKLKKFDEDFKWLAKALNKLEKQKEKKNETKR